MMGLPALRSALHMPTDMCMETGAQDVVKKVTKLSV